MAGNFSAVAQVIFRGLFWGCFAEVFDMSALTDKLAAYGCNIDEAMGRFLNNEAFYAKCYGKFVADKSFARLGEALQAGDVKGAFEAAHDLKGISANMGITPVYGLIVGMVEVLRAGKMPEDAMETYQRLMEMHADLESFAG